MLQCVGMSIAMFDTPAAARKLRAAGVDSRQAEAQAELIAAAVRNMRDDPVTKADLAAAVSGLENRMLKVAVGLSLAVVTGQTALTAGLLKLLQ